MKEVQEYILIYFNDDGGATITYTTKEETEELLREVLADYDSNPVEYFLTPGEVSNGIESGYLSDNKKYLIIKGKVVTPEVREVITKLHIE